MKVKLIVAYCKGRGIGHKDHIPWDHPEDLRYFSKKTKGKGNNAIIMGKTTYASIGRPLPGRCNIILSSTFNNPALYIGRSLEDAIEHCRQEEFTDAWIIGGLGITSKYLIILCIITILLLIILEQYNKKCILSNEEWCIFTKQVAPIAVLFYIAKLFYNLSE